MTIHLADAGLPVHPFTGLTAIGVRRNGDPIWPVKGGSEDGGDDDQGDGDDGSDKGDDEGDEKLGDPGKKALDEMKGKWHRSRDALKPWSALAREHGVRTPEELKAKLAAGASNDDQAAADKVRREAQAEADTKANRRIVRAEVKAAAAGKFADPADAVAFLNLDDFEVDQDGEVDGDAISDALDDLLKKKPHLAAQGGRRFAGSGDGGHRGNAKTDPGPGISRLTYAYANSGKTK